MINIDSTCFQLQARTRGAHWCSEALTVSWKSPDLKLIVKTQLSSLVRYEVRLNRIWQNSW